MKRSNRRCAEQEDLRTDELQLEEDCFCPWTEQEHDKQGVFYKCARMVQCVEPMHMFGLKCQGIGQHVRQCSSSWQRALNGGPLVSEPDGFGADDDMYRVKHTSGPGDPRTMPTPHRSTPLSDSVAPPM